MAGFQSETLKSITMKRAQVKLTDLTMLHFVHFQMIWSIMSELFAVVVTQMVLR